MRCRSGLPAGLTPGPLQRSRRPSAAVGRRESCITIFFFNRNVDFFLFKIFFFFSQGKMNVYTTFFLSTRLLRKAIRSGILLKRRRFDYHRYFLLIIYFQSKFHEIIFKIKPDSFLERRFGNISFMLSENYQDLEKGKDS